MNSARVTVSLGERSYDIEIGRALLERAGQLLAPHLNRQRVYVVADATARALHGARLAAGLGAEGIAAVWIDIAPGEQSKSFATLEALVERLIVEGVDRRDLILAFGGGVTGDLAGFAAAIVKRGCAFVQAPTTLLAQVDSAVGGKTAINSRAGKNLVGVFHQPAAVIADVDTLDTLPPRALRAGYAEIVKYGALGDAAFFADLERNGAALLSGDKGVRIDAVRRSCAMKAAIVTRDETETGERALLNLGHTFGHALEAAYGYSDALLHGEAVAAGMGIALDFSVARGFCQPDEARRLKSHLAAVGLPTGFGDLPPGPKLDPDALLALMEKDKKSVGGRLALILARRIGEAFVEAGVDRTALRAFLADGLAKSQARA